MCWLQDPFPRQYLASWNFVYHKLLFFTLTHSEIHLPFLLHLLLYLTFRVRPLELGPTLPNLPSSAHINFPGWPGWSQCFPNISGSFSFLPTIILNCFCPPRAHFLCEFLPDFSSFFKNKICTIQCSTSLYSVFFFNCLIFFFTDDCRDCVCIPFIGPMASNTMKAIL